MEYNLCDINTVKKILSRHGFTFSKALGQNFLIDSEVCPAMAELLDADKSTGVLEVGPGIGVLTKELCRVAGRVVAIELDERLYPVLGETLADYDNFTLVKGDAMKLDLKQIISEHFSGCSEVKVCANLPYYITSPIIMMLLESGLDISEIEVMVQQEAGERLTAPVGSREAGAVSVAVSYYGDSELLMRVPRQSFLPSPKVDSAVIRIRLHKSRAYDVKDEAKLFRLVKAAFAQRRKTLVNSISNTLGIEKSRIADALSQLGLDASIRAEKLTMEDFVNLTDLLL